MKGWGISYTILLPAEYQQFHVAKKYNWSLIKEKRLSPRLSSSHHTILSISVRYYNQTGSSVSTFYDKQQHQGIN